MLAGYFIFFILVLELLFFLSCRVCVSACLCLCAHMVLCDMRIDTQITTACLSWGNNIIYFSYSVALSILLGLFDFDEMVFI